MRRTIHPGHGVDDFRLGMTRPELWALTDSTVHAFYRGGASEREDDFLKHGFQVEYLNGRARGFDIFARMAGSQLTPIVVLDEDVSGYHSDDIKALLELHHLPREDGYEHIIVPSLGLTFWFRDELEGGPAPLEFVRVEATDEQ